MRALSRKVLISLLTTIFILITISTTTYAWVGILTYSSTDRMQLNLEVVDLNKEYYLTISGNDQDYGDSVPLIDIQRQILQNMGKSNSYFDPMTAPNREVELEFSKINLGPVSTNLEAGNIKSFYEYPTLMYNANKRITNEKHYKFDIYLSVDAKEGLHSTTEINSNIFLNNIQETLVGNIGTSQIVNDEPFASLPSDDPRAAILKNLPSNLTINSASAARFALEIYSPIKKEDEYDNSYLPVKTIFYQGGTNEPSVVNNVYSLGGNLPEDYNFALKEINAMYRRYLDTPIEVLNRGDLELIEENRLVWEAPITPDSSNINYLGIVNGVQTKMKITVYFWFEGFDADCSFQIDKKLVEFNLALSNVLEV